MIKIACQFILYFLLSVYKMESYRERTVSHGLNVPAMLDLGAHVSSTHSPVRIGVSLPESNTNLVPGAFQQTRTTEILHHCSLRLFGQNPCGQTANTASYLG